MKKSIESVNPATSAIVKANHTEESTPNDAMIAAAGRSITICLTIETIIEA